jgi:hypothetical protein
MKYAEDRPYADPEKAARRLMELAQAVEPVQDGRIHIEKINYPLIDQEKAKLAEYSAGLKLAIERGRLWMHESGTYVKLTPERAELLGGLLKYSSPAGGRPSCCLRLAHTVGSHVHQHNQTTKDPFLTSTPKKKPQLSRGRLLGL